MTTHLSILNSSGDTKISWDTNDPEASREMRKMVAHLKANGYSFFLVGGKVADEVTAGDGELLVRRLTAEQVIEPDAAEPEPIAETPEESKPAPNSRRGRKAKDVAEGRQVVAVRPLAGG